MTTEVSQQSLLATHLLDGQPARNLRHGCKDGKGTIWLLNCLIGNAGGLAGDHGLCQLARSSKVEEREHSVVGLDEVVLALNWLLHLDDHIR